MWNSLVWWKTFYWINTKLSLLADSPLDKHKTETPGVSVLDDHYPGLELQKTRYGRTRTPVVAEEQLQDVAVLGQHCLAN